MTPSTDGAPLWTPPPAAASATAMGRFLQQVAARHAPQVVDYPSLWRWSIDSREAFWRALWDFCAVVGEPGDAVLDYGERLPGSRWFPQARLNYAENLLRHCLATSDEDAAAEADALVFRAEHFATARLSRRQLLAEVARCQAALRAAGVEAGDRVAGYLPNMPQAIVAMLATTALGAVWTSASPDFGVQGVLDRFGQTAPKVLLCVDAYWYNGRRVDCRTKNREIAARLSSLRVVVEVALAAEPAADAVVGWPAADGFDAPRVVGWDAFLAAHAGGRPEFRRVAFDHPLFILYSSGTTGVPKCIVHGHGGTLLQHLKEHCLHGDLRPGDRLFYFTTCGWMMWNWLASGLACGATLLLYDGSPFAGPAGGPSSAPGGSPRAAPEGKSGSVLFDYAEAEHATHFGTSAKYLDAAAKQGLAPIATHRLEALRVIFSTGSPLVAEGFDYVYRAIKRDVLLASISGGTDIVSCFVLGCPLLPVWRGEIQCAGLAMAVAVFDAAGQPLAQGRGELVCTRSFPAMPVGFWNDADGARYRAAYFERFPGAWHHGDYVETTAHGGFVIHGRSDATLNPGGVRIGTAEIYRQVEQIDGVVESLVIGQQQGGDERIVLFVRLRQGLALDDALRERIRNRIRSNTTARHVPSKIVQVRDLPRTRSGKLVELAVRRAVHGMPVDNLEALANPESLAEFRDRPELAS